MAVLSVESNVMFNVGGVAVVDESVTPSAPSAFSVNDPARDREIPRLSFLLTCGVGEITSDGLVRKIFRDNFAE